MVRIGESKPMVLARLEKLYALGKPNDGLLLVATKPATDSNGVTGNVFLGKVEFSDNVVSKVTRDWERGEDSLGAHKLWDALYGLAHAIVGVDTEVAARILITQDRAPGFSFDRIQVYVGRTEIQVHRYQEKAGSLSPHAIDTIAVSESVF